MIKKRMLINMISSIIAFCINTGITFFLTPYIVNRLGSEAYSFVAISNNFISIISIITVALNSMASRFISIEINSNRIDKANEYFSSVFISNIILSIALTIPSILCIVFIEYIFNIPKGMVTDVKLTFILVFINIIFSLIGNVFGVASFTKNRVDLSSICLIIGNLIRLIFTTILFLFFDPHIYFITGTNLVVSIVTILSNINFTRKLLPELRVSIKKFRVHRVKKLLSSGIWNSLNQLSNVLLNQLDLVIINIFVGYIASGKYSIVKIIPSFMLSFISMITNIFIPKFMIDYAQQKYDNLIDNIDSSMKILSMIISLPIGFLMIFGDIFFSLWVPQENAETLNLLSQVTLIPLIFTGCGNMIFNVYTITNKLKLPALVMIACGILKTLSVLILLNITNLGIMTVPIVSAIINIFIYITFMPSYASKCLNIKTNNFNTNMIKCALCTINMMIMCLVIRKYYYINTWNELFISAAISAIIMGIANYFIVFPQKDRENMISLILKN